MSEQAPEDDDAAFVGDGFVPFPNLHSDAREVSSITEWSDEQLEYKTNQYGEFLQREDIQARAKKTGGRILDLCIFELACRDGIHGQRSISQLEDEACDNA